jgi:hypothetical protein
VKLFQCIPWRRMGNGGTTPLILKRGTRWRWVIRFTPQPIYPRYSLFRTLLRFQKRSGSFREETRTWFLVFPAYSPFTTINSRSQLLGGVCIWCENMKSGHVPKHLSSRRIGKSIKLHAFLTSEVYGSPLDPGNHWRGWIRRSAKMKTPSASNIELRLYIQ